MSRLHFQLEAQASGSSARAGRYRTLHGEVKTPLFMPVGTQAAVRNQTPKHLADSGSQVLLANTFHLLLRPGPEVFRKMGGIHRFMNWNGSVLTDSGGYQIFSLPEARLITEEGARFKSLIDSSPVHLTPELAIETQKAIGSDIMMVLDQCVPSTSGYALAKEAMERTHRWAKRSLEARGDSPQSLFGIVQGACFEDLRRASADALCSFPFDGFAIGGLAVGESRSEREDFTELAANLLPRDLPRYLMGVGTPIDLLEAVHRGVDQFDCIIPVSWAQQGVAFTTRGRLALRRSVYRVSEDALDPDCDCSACTEHSRAYLHHLIKAKEPLAWQLIATHNLHFYHRLMSGMRAAILDDTFSNFYRTMKPKLEAGDEENPARPGKPKRRRTPRLELGDYEVHESAHGFSSIRQKSSREIMHSVSEPSQEAKRLYVEQSKLVERTREEGPEFVIWDVGLGAATNAMAAIQALEETQVKRPVRIVSFENDLDSMRLALLNHARFPHLRHAGPRALLETARWNSKSIPLQWELVLGDFLKTGAGAPAPDLIFYDPFSPKVDSPLWTLECFRALREACRSKPVELFTYSASSKVRANLLAAGFFVAQGVPTGPKEETTIALTEPSTEFAMLGREWLARWGRSDARTESLDRLIRAHPQFSFD